MDFIKKLRLPDYFSMTALFFAWLSIVFVISGEPNWAIISNITAFTFDLIDGYTARKLKINSKVGREIDSTVDISTYLIFTALFFYTFLSVNIFMGVLVGFCILLFGILRLIRFNTEGILSDTKGNYYRGVTVVHLDLAALVGYFLHIFLGIPLLITGVVILVMCPFMLSNVKSYKWNSLYYAVIGILLLLLSLFVQYGYHQ